uniref:Protein kinase domain-containing protein n=1 Tax=Macrostomum lignano TaxID=282301 RepID=A0A1I8JHM7_9PLAT
STDGSGDTAAHLAARRDHLRLLTLLSFDAKWLQNRRGATPLMEAARTGSWRCAKHLLHLLRQKQFNECEKYGNSERERLLGLKDVDGRTALDLARLGDHSELASDIEREMRLVVSNEGYISGLTDQEKANRKQLKLATSGNSAGLRQLATQDGYDLPDKYGRPALIWAAGNSNCSDEYLWEQLLQLADPTCADMWSESCLHHAAWSGNSVAASALLYSGASVNAKDEQSVSPLMRATISASPSAATAVCRVLLDSGSDWSLEDQLGRTARDLARENGKAELEALLRGCETKVYFDEPLELPEDHPPFLEDWETGRLIGRGGFGEVHEVLTDTGIRCAAKTLRLPVHLGDQLDFIRKKIESAIESESNLCRLRHPNIVRFLHMAQPEPATVVVFMELLDGRSLERFIDNKPLDEAVVRSFSKQICSALLYLHSRRPPVIHRDINCSNIIVLTDNTRIKLIDFGLSIKLEKSVSHISATTQTPEGTLNFMAPELLGAGEADRPQYSRESDIWAFGCSVFQMATGSRPFADVPTIFQVAVRLERSGAPAIRDGCSVELKDFYSQCTARNRIERKPADELMKHQFLASRKLDKRGLMNLSLDDGHFIKQPKLD